MKQQRENRAARLEATVTPVTQSGTDMDVAGLLESLPQAALISGLDGTVMAANARAAALLGVPEPVGTPLSEVLSPGHAITDALSELGGGPPLHAEVRVTGRSGSLHLRVTPLRRANGQMMGALVIADDAAPEQALRQRCAELTAELDRVRADFAERLAEARRATTLSEEQWQATSEELQILNEELRERLQQLGEAERMNERKNEFLAMLAHELRNPLAPLVNALHIVRERGSAEPLVRRALQVADRQVHHQTRLLNDLLDVSRLAAGKITLDRSATDLTAIVRQAVEAIEITSRPRAQQLTLQLPPAPLFVDGDTTRLEQVVSNLLSNAVKYTPPGGRIDVRLVERDGHAVLTVTDTGVGIAPEVLPQVFDLFVQGDSSLARSQGGLGIGLTLVRRLVELHGGTAAARSKGPGHGSEFEVCLPARPRPDEVDRAGPTRGPGGERLRIVVIEDNRDAREMLRLLLELQGHQVGEAADGPAGVHAAVTSAPDVVLLDIGLPGMDGYQVARRLRSRMGSGVRLVALTGYSDPETRRATAAAGFDAHLVKPVEPAELTRVLATLA